MANDNDLTLNESANYENFLSIAEDQIKTCGLGEVENTRGWLEGFAAGLHETNYITDEELDKAPMDIAWIARTKYPSLSEAPELDGTMDDILQLEELGFSRAQILEMVIDRVIEVLATEPEDDDW